MAEEVKLNLGRGVAFVKSQLKRVPRCEEVWEADFEALPKPITQSRTDYLGMVVTKVGENLLADLPVQGRPSVNDLATLLAHAMRRPLAGNSRRPRLVRVRGHHQWRELFPHLAELGVEVSVERKLPGIASAYQAHMRRLNEEARVGLIGPTKEQQRIEAVFPLVARYVRKYGRIEIGEDENCGFVVRAISCGGVDFEDNRPDTLAESMAVLEAGLAQWFEEQGVDPDD